MTNSIAMLFKENLPPSCPPNGAVTPDDNETAFRLLVTNVATDEDFKSHQELNPETNYSDKCRFRAVSLVRTFVQCQDAIKLKRMKKFKFAAQLCLTSSSGIVERDRDDHMNWWLAASCDHKKVTTAIVEL